MGVCGRVLGAAGEGGCGCAGGSVGAADLGEELLIVGVRRVLEGLLAKLSFACESAKGAIASVHVHGSHQCTSWGAMALVPVVAERGP